MNQTTALRYEVNFLTAEIMGRKEMIRTIEAEFDFIRMCQGMIKPFGLQARKTLDRFIALSLRKLLCDEHSMLKTVCPGFKMPPLLGDIYYCAGENNDMKLSISEPDIHIKPQNEWIPLDEWLKRKIAWIDKGVNDIPDLYEDDFFNNIADRIGNNTLTQFFIKETIEESGHKENVWRLKDPQNNREKVYEILKTKGYYHLTVKRMIKYFADKQGAHLDANDVPWIRMVNDGTKIGQSIMSVFAIHTMYAATKQIHELKNYMEVNPMLEILQ